MNYISYIDEKNNERLYDSFMLRTRLRMNKSRLQKELNQYNFTSDDYIVFKNQYLFKESSVVRFIENIVMKKYLTNRRKITNERLNGIRQSIKDFIRNDELHKD